MPLFDQLWRMLVKLAKKLREIFAPILLFLFRRHPTIASAVCLLFVMSGALAWKYTVRSHRYEQIVTETMETELESTPQTYKALEAFILSGGAKDIQSKVADATISAYFWKQLRDIDTTLRSHPSSTGGDLTKLFISIVDPASPPTSVDESIVTDTAKHGFLFLPLGRNTVTLSDDKLKVIVGCQLNSPECTDPNSNTIDAQLRGDARLMDDVNTSNSVIGSVFAVLSNEAFDGKDLDGILRSSPDQAYYLTSNGLNRIVSRAEAKGEKGSQIYASQFKATTFFPSRPYYIGATAREHSDTDPVVPLSTALTQQRPQLKKLFYVSKPYFDIGGNGVVVTLALPIHYPGHSDGAICFDLPILPDAMLGKALINRVHLLDGKVAVLSCSVAGDALCEVDSSSDSGFEDGFKRELEHQISKSFRNGSVSQIGGDINVLQPSGTVAKPSDYWNLKDDFWYVFQVLGGKQKSFWFSVPSSPLRDVGGQQKVTFVGSTLNLNRFVMKTAAYGVLALMCLFAGLLLIIWSWHDDAKRSKDMQEAFAEIGRVMMACPTPYLRLDSTDRIVDANLATCILLKGAGSSIADLNSLKGQTFASFIDGSDSARYDSVQQQRKNNEIVGEYVLHLRTQNGLQSVTVHSSRVPSTGEEPGGLPDTFGILTHPPSPPNTNPPAPLPS